MAMTKPIKWTDQERFLLEVLASRYPIQRITWAWDKYKQPDWPHRTESAIRTQIARIGISQCPDTDFLSANHVARLLGVNCKTVHRWIKAGKLYASKLSATRYGIRVRNLDQTLPTLNLPPSVTAEARQYIHALYRETESFEYDERSHRN